MREKEETYEKVMVEYQEILSETDFMSFVFSFSQCCQWSTMDPVAAAALAALKYLEQCCQYICECVCVYQFILICHFYFDSVFKQCTEQNQAILLQESPPLNIYKVLYISASFFITVQVYDNLMKRIGVRWKPFSSIDCPNR